MRHIPEEELHAYLDQALSRSQCVEIERHLSRCPRCQLERDTIAALRDRTTELLARIGPPPIVAPPFGLLLQRAVSRRVVIRHQRLVRGAWAASIVVAVCSGWAVNRSGHRPPPVTLGEVSHASVAAPVVAVTSPAASAPVTRTATRPAMVAPHPHHLMRASTPAPETPSYGFARVVETDPETAFGTARAEPLTFGSVPVEDSEIATQPVGADPGLRGLWRTFVPDNGTAPSTGDIPLVPGLAVVAVGVQAGFERILTAKSKVLR